MHSVCIGLLKFGKKYVVLRKMSACNFKGVPLEAVYRGFEPFELDHLPKIENKRNHTVCFQLPIEQGSTKPPKPHVGEKKWDGNHVRLPCAVQNEYNATSGSDPSKSYVTNRWEIIQTALLRDITSSHELEQAILSYNEKYAKEWSFVSLHALFEEYIHDDDCQAFFQLTLPKIIRLALQLPDIIPMAIPLLKRGQNRSISLTQQQIACILANAFLCTFPRRNQQTRRSEYWSFPSINFSGLYQTPGSQNIEKIKCLCNYFRRVTSKMPCGVVTFTRRSIPDDQLPDWDDFTMGFEKSMLHVSAQGTIEDDGDGLLQVDFANKYIGGGVLNYGCVQEEIRFVICPELLCSRLFTESLSDTECMVIMGCERFNEYTGYASGFEWSSDYQDQTPVDEFGRRKCTITAIDAIPFQSKIAQFREDAIRREINKAYIGFMHSLSTPAPAVATGNWGCGAFNGNKQLKSLLQLMACCVTKRPLVYYTFGDEQFCDELSMIHEYLSTNKVKIGELWSYLLQYAEEKSKADLYNFIIECHQEPRERKSKINPPPKQADTSKVNKNPRSRLCPPSTSVHETKLEDSLNIDGNNYNIENSDEDDQFSPDEVLAQMDAAGENNEKPKKSKDSRPSIKDPVDKQKDLDLSNRHGRTIKSFFGNQSNENESQEKRSRARLIDFLDDGFYQDSKVKVKMQQNPTDRSEHSTPNTSSAVDASLNESSTDEFSPNKSTADESMNESIGYESSVNESTAGEASPIKASNEDELSDGEQKVQSISSEDEASDERNESASHANISAMSQDLFSDNNMACANTSFTSPEQTISPSERNADRLKFEKKVASPKTSRELFENYFNVKSPVISSKTATKSKSNSRKRSNKTSSPNDSSTSATGHTKMDVDEETPCSPDSSSELRSETNQLEALPVAPTDGSPGSDGSPK